MDLARQKMPEKKFIITKAFISFCASRSNRAKSSKDFLMSGIRGDEQKLLEISQHKQAETFQLMETLIRE